MQTGLKHREGLEGFFLLACAFSLFPNDLIDYTHVLDSEREREKVVEEGEIRGVRKDEEGNEEMGEDWRKGKRGREWERNGVRRWRRKKRE